MVGDVGRAIAELRAPSLELQTVLVFIYPADLYQWIAECLGLNWTAVGRIYANALEFTISTVISSTIHHLAAGVRNKRSS